MANQADANKKSVIVISLLTAACLLGDSMLYVVLPIHWQDVGLASLWEVGILLSVNRIVRLPLNPLVSWLYGRISSRSGLTFAAILAVCTTFSYAFVQGFVLWLILRCIWGLAWTFLRLGAYFTILEVTGENNRGHYMGMYNGLYRLGSLVGMLTGGFLADRYGVGVTAILFGFMTFLAIPFTFQLFACPSGHAPDTNKSLDVSALINANVLWTLLTGLFIAMVYQGTFTATLSYLIQVHNSSPILLFGTTIGAASLAGTLQALRWGWEPWLAPLSGKLSDGKYSRNTILTATLILAAVSFSLLPLPLPLEWWLLLILIILLTATVLTTIIDAIACDVAFCSPPKTFMSAYSFAIDIGAALGPLAGYTLNDLSGPYAVYWAIAGGLSIFAVRWLIWPISIYKK
ncbi:MFS transporter [Acetonema longum]|uniref:Major facilitator superfamily MFS_1 n=1 Tax=Acetonema longum DSM 6540 TaxID=1009370 RepID=F7NHB0_9FIRM|nr:MFS transporter [Acetonema longum]EGO64593.1 major facilitator superfamily MFS_1 [Acetonema longum DSM 6540]